MQRTFTSYVLLITGFLACPCHLPLTLPLLIAFFGGSALGGWLATHTGLVIGLSTGYFIAALVVGFWLLNDRGNRRARSPDGAACCPPVTAQRDTTASVEGGPR
jgi:hypothetical protein